MLDGLRISPASFMKQVLQSPTVLERPSHLRFEFVRNIDGGATPLDSAIQDVAGVLLAVLTCGAVRPRAGALSQAEGPERRGPQVGGLCPEPALNVGRRFNLTWHGMYMCHSTHMRVKSLR